MSRPVLSAWEVSAVWSILKVLDVCEHSITSRYCVADKILNGGRFKILLLCPSLVDVRHCCWANSLVDVSLLSCKQTTHWVCRKWLLMDLDSSKFWACFKVTFSAVTSIDFVQTFTDSTLTAYCPTLTPNWVFIEHLLTHPNGTQ